MDKTKQEDLRVRKTREAIRRTFEDMICEMDYEKISVKELTDRAMINRKTFYLHYETLDDLLEELQQKLLELSGRHKLLSLLYLHNQRL